MSDALTDEGTIEEARGAARLWWVVLLLGILWIIYGWIVLTFTFKTVLAVAVFAGVAFIAAGITEFFFASQVDSWKWLWIILGVISVGAGIIALVWPSETFLVLAAIIGWYLMLRGRVRHRHGLHDEGRERPLVALARGRHRARSSSASGPSATRAARSPCS